LWRHCGAVSFLAHPLHSKVWKIGSAVGGLHKSKIGKLLGSKWQNKLRGIYKKLTDGNGVSAWKPACFGSK